MELDNRVVLELNRETSRATHLSINREWLRVHKHRSMSQIVKHFTEINFLALPVPSREGSGSTRGLAAQTERRTRMSPAALGEAQIQAPEVPYDEIGDASVVLHKKKRGE